MASSLLVNPFTKNNGEPASSSLYRFSVHCLYQDFVKSCVFFYFFHQRSEEFHDLLPLSCRTYEILATPHFQRISCRSCAHTESKSSASSPVINCIGTRHIVEQGTFYFRNRIKFTAFFRRRVPPVLQAVHFGYGNKADQIVQKRKHNQNQCFHDSSRLCFIQNVNIRISVKYRKEKNNTQNNLDPRPETGFNFPVYFKNIDPVKQLFFLQSCNYTCIYTTIFPTAS